VVSIGKLIQLMRVASHPPLLAGDWVEVKSREQILATLDKDGNLDGMPFMPEMLRYCGQRFPVYKRAHKTCDYSTGGMEARRVPSTVHLDGLRCTGEAHGGCQAECLLFWKEAWLKKVDGSRPSAEPADIVPASVGNGKGDGCTEAELHAAAIVTTEPEPIYSCQATRIPRFTSRLPPSQVDQYVEAHASRNFRLSEMPAPLLFRAYERLVRSRLGRTGIPQRIYDIFQQLRGGVPWPNRPGMIPTGQATPRG